MSRASPAASPLQQQCAILRDKRNQLLQTKMELISKQVDNGFNNQLQQACEEITAKLEPFEAGTQLLEQSIVQKDANITEVETSVNQVGEFVSWLYARSANYTQQVDSGKRIVEERIRDATTNDRQRLEKFLQMKNEIGEADKRSLAQVLSYLDHLKNVAEETRRLNREKQAALNAKKLLWESARVENDLLQKRHTQLLNADSRAQQKLKELGEKKERMKVRNSRLEECIAKQAVERKKKELQLAVAEANQRDKRDEAISRLTAKRNEIEQLKSRTATLRSSEAELDKQLNELCNKDTERKSLDLEIDHVHEKLRTISCRKQEADSALKTVRAKLPDDMRDWTLEQWKRAVDEKKTSDAECEKRIAVAESELASHTELMEQIDAQACKLDFRWTELEKHLCTELAQHKGQMAEFMVKREEVSEKRSQLERDVSQERVRCGYLRTEIERIKTGAKDATPAPTIDEPNPVKMARVAQWQTQCDFETPKTKAPALTFNTQRSDDSDNEGGGSTISETFPVIPGIRVLSPNTRRAREEAKELSRQARLERENQIREQFRVREEERKRALLPHPVLDKSLSQSKAQTQAISKPLELSPFSDDLSPVGEQAAPEEKVTSSQKTASQATVELDQSISDPNDTSVESDDGTWNDFNSTILKKNPVDRQKLDIAQMSLLSSPVGTVSQQSTRDTLNDRFPHDIFLDTTPTSPTIFEDLPLSPILSSVRGGTSAAQEGPRMFISTPKPVKQKSIELPALPELRKTKNIRKKEVNRHHSMESLLSQRSFRVFEKHSAAKHLSQHSRESDVSQDSYEETHTNTVTRSASLDDKMRKAAVTAAPAQVALLPVDMNESISDLNDTVATDPDQSIWSMNGPF